MPPLEIIHDNRSPALPPSKVTSSRKICNRADIFRVDLGLLAGQIPPAQGLCPLVQLRLPGQLDGGLRPQSAADSGAEVAG